jgi:hypothetical protein
VKHFNSKQAVDRISQNGSIAVIDPIDGERPALPRKSKESRNKANTIRNSAKVEQYLMEVEKAQGFAQSWALRERLEQGHVSLDDLMQAGPLN